VTLDVVLFCARYAFLGASLVSFGAALFPLYARAPAPARLLGFAALIALITGTAAIGLQAVELGAPLGALAATSFGQVWTAQLTLTALLTLASWTWRPLALPFAGGVLVCFAMVSHGAAIGGALGAASYALHLCAAGGWIGGLAALALALRRAPQPVLVRRFSNAGLWFVAAVATTGAFNLVVVTGAAFPHAQTHYGQLASLKIALFALALLIAAFNRLSLTPKAAWPLLGRTILAELGLLAVLVGVALTLGAQPPTL